MHIVLLGISHQTASVEIREKLSFSERQLPCALARLMGLPEVLEVAVLSTCNRTEIYAVTADPARAREAIGAYWTGMKRCAADDLKVYGYWYEGEDAVRHLHRVTAGVDSLIVGEGQILAQVKAALASALERQAAGQYLTSLFQQALKAGKHVRTATNIGRGSVSVSSAAVEVAVKALGELTGKTVLIYGAGKMSSHTIKALKQRGVGRVLIANRTIERAREAAAELGCEAISLEAGFALHTEADVIICCTAAPNYLLTPSNYPAAAKPRLLIDIAVPRNIDPALAALPDVHWVDLDGLEAVARTNREERAGQIIDAEVMIDAHMRDYKAKLASFELAPTIQAFKTSLAAAASAELEEFTREHQGLIARDPHAALAHFAHALVGRLGHMPVVRLKAQDEQAQTAHAEALASLFDLEVEPASHRYLRKRQHQLEKARASERL